MEDDNELMLAFKESDESYFEKILSKYEKPLINFIYRFIGNYWDAEDLAQEVFLKIYKNRKKHKPKANFSTYLYKIATNICIDYQRKKRIKTISLDLLNNEYEGSKQEILASSNEASHAFLDRQEVNKIVRSAILSLPENQRFAISLRVYENKSYKEISKILSCSISAVESLLFRARQNLKKKLLNT